MEFTNKDIAGTVYEQLSAKSVDCELRENTIKIKNNEVYSLLGDLKQLSNVKKIEDVSNSVKEAYIAMEEK